MPVDTSSLIVMGIGAGPESQKSTNRLESLWSLHLEAKRYTGPFLPEHSAFIVARVITIQNLPLMPLSLNHSFKSG